MLGLWRGLGPNVARNAIVNAAELASFDQVDIARDCACREARVLQHKALRN